MKRDCNRKIFLILIQLIDSVSGQDRLSELKQRTIDCEHKAKVAYRNLISVLESSGPSDLTMLKERFREQTNLMIRSIEAYGAYVVELEKFLPL